MTIKQELENFLEKNRLLKESPNLYHTYYKVKNYEYDSRQNKHSLNIVSILSANQVSYELEKIGSLNLELSNCLKEKEEIVYFWNKNKLELSDSFTFEGEFKGENYYWTVFPKEVFAEEQNAQKYIDKNYPKEERDEIANLNVVGIKTKDIGWKLLEGHLDLSDFVNLKELDCSDNQLTSLNISDNSQIKKLYCSKNLLTGIDSLLFKLNPEKLKELDLSNNNFPESDLSIFSKFTNLESLLISNNNFFGSLKPLKGLTKLKTLDLSDTDLSSGVECLPDSLNTIYCSTEYKLDSKIKQIKEQLGLWRWIKRGFNLSEIKSWLEAGAKTNDYNFISWLRDIQKLDAEWILQNKEKFQDLKEKYEYLGTCKECQQLNVGRDWCQSCNKKHWQEQQWTSGNTAIDQFIKHYQLRAFDSWNVLEWIPYEQFTNIEHIADGGFGKVYKAKWTEGLIRKWSVKHKQWKRGSEKEVALKILSGSQNISTEFLQEIDYYKKFTSEINNVVPCYGISCDPEGNYIMVMEYMKEGNLRQYLQKNYKKLTFEDKFKQLHDIAKGLKEVHQQKLVHRDFHSGNILYPPCRITDLGLSRPVSETDSNKVYGVLPYVAPEVLRSNPYTQASDIYSFGIIAYEILSGLPPYSDRNHDTSLALEVCRGLRPQFPDKVKMPALLINLVKRCWDTDPLQRPTASEINDLLENWLNEIDDYYGKENYEIYQQIQEAEKINKKLPEGTKFPNYKLNFGATTSKIIDTQNITKLLEKSQLVNLAENYQITSNLSLTLDNIDLEDNQTKLETKFEVPPKLK